MTDNANDGREILTYNRQLFKHLFQQNGVSDDLRALAKSDEITYTTDTQGNDKPGVIELTFYSGDDKKLGPNSVVGRWVAALHEVARIDGPEGTTVEADVPKQASTNISLTGEPSTPIFQRTVKIMFNPYAK